MGNILTLLIILVIVFGGGYLVMRSEIRKNQRNAKKSPSAKALFDQWKNGKLSFIDFKTQLQKTTTLADLTYDEVEVLVKRLAINVFQLDQYIAGLSNKQLYDLWLEEKIDDKRIKLLLAIRGNADGLTPEEVQTLKERGIL